MPRLEIFQSDWTMERRHPDGREWSLEEKFRMARDAGYDGMCLDLAENDIPLVDAGARFWTKYDLKASFNAFPRSVDELDRLLLRARDLDARIVSINARYFPLTPREGADFVKACLERCHERGVNGHFETHRDTLTTDALYTIQLFDLVPDMKVVVDLSHYVVGREMSWPLSGVNLEIVERVLERTAGLQGRVATAEQIQVPLAHGRSQVEVESFFGWWEEGMRHWLAAANEDDVLTFLCELGPPPYAITDNEGYELSDRWEEALVMKRRIDDLWTALTGPMNGRS